MILQDRDFTFFVSVFREINCAVHLFLRIQKAKILWARFVMERITVRLSKSIPMMVAVTSKFCRVRPPLDGLFVP